jgi:hypothetical protein
VAAALVAALVLAAVLTAGVALVQLRSAAPEASRLELGPPPAVDTVEGAPARLILDVTNAELILDVADAGEAIGVEARFDPRRYSLQEHAEPDDDGWTYRVGFGPRGWSALALLRLKMGGELPSLRVRIPRDLPVEIEGSMVRTFVVAELGGSNVRAVDLSLDQGWAEVGFGRPLARPMKRFELSGHRGALSVDRLGNASPATTRLRHGMGTMRIDLQGAWLRDAEIAVEGSFVGGMVRLPENARVEGLARGTLEPPAEGEHPLPTLRLELSGSAGHLVVADPRTPDRPRAP